jgi:hypothetical protein
VKDDKRFSQHIKKSAIYIHKSVLQRHFSLDTNSLFVLFPPNRSYLEVEISLSQDQIGNYADKALLYANTCMKELRRLFLVQDLIDSLKVSLCLISRLLQE